MRKRAASDSDDATPPRARHRHDAGTTFVEILVSIVLLGTTVIATLTAVRTTVIATATERDHAKAQQWLQSAIGVIESYDFPKCNSSTLSGDEVKLVYDTLLQTGIDTDLDTVIDAGPAERPEGWNLGTGAEIDVKTPLVWDGLSPGAFVPFNVQSQCYDSNLLRQQLLTIEVRAPSGEIIEDVEVVKRDQLNP